MELKEFKKEIKEYGYKVSNYDKEIYTISKNNKFIKYISKQVIKTMIRDKYEAISFINYKLGGH